MADSHKMGDRTLEVKIPQSKAAGFDDVIDSSGGQRLSRRIHVSNITTRIGRRDIEDYFSQFGPITDVFIPKETEVNDWIRKMDVWFHARRAKYFNIGLHYIKLYSELPRHSTI